MQGGTGVTDTVPVESTPPEDSDAPASWRRLSHAARPASRTLRVTAAAAGGLAAVAAATVGSVALLRTPATGSDGVTAARKITVAAPVIPLSDSELVGLLDRPPDFGSLADPTRRASCLAGLGYPASTPVLGARRVRIEDRDAVVLVLAADTPDDLAVVAVPGTCSAANTGLLADTTVRRR